MVKRLRALEEGLDRREACALAHLEVRRLDLPQLYSLVSVPDVTPEPQPLFCRLQSLGVPSCRITTCGA